MIFGYLQFIRPIVKLAKVTHIRSIIMSTLSLPNDVIKRMICLGCNNFLSLYPIYIKKDGTGAVCGRCKPTDDNRFLRDEGYEALAQFLTFPCIYKENGCPKNLVPSLMEEHEPCCEFRKFGCPSVNYTKCNWEGPKNALFKHFGEQHPNLVIKDQKFEIDFDHSIEETLIMKMNEDLFVVKKDIDSRKGIFVCSVEYLKSLEKDDVYNYRVRVESNTRNYFHNCNERLADGDDATKLMANFLKEKLQEPLSMFVMIEVFKTTVVPNGVIADQVERVQKNTSIDWQLLSELECPVCYDYMLPPIYQCSTGHSICKTCKPQVSNVCPTCKQPIPVQATQNFALEKLTQYIIYPCKHHKLGCQFTSRASDIEAHELSCQYGPFECPLKGEKDCQWTGAVSEILVHVENNHNDSLLKTERIEELYNSNGTSTNTFLIIFNKKVFKFLYNYGNRFCQWSMQIAGSMEDSKEFKFELDIFDTTGGKKRFLISGPVVPLLNPINASNCIKLADETISLFVTNKLTYLVRIFKEN